ncbi:MAG TPA: hypothetical protein VGF81_02660 [Solirubrobacteraceae bacterium]
MGSIRALLRAAVLAALCLGLLAATAGSARAAPVSPALVPASVGLGPAPASVTSSSTFDDEFNGSSIDSTLWNTDVATTGNRFCPDKPGSFTGVWTDISVDPCHKVLISPPYASVTEGGGVASFAAPPGHTFGYLVAGPPSRHPFPSAGDFVFELRIRYDATVSFGDGVLLSPTDNADPVGTNSPWTRSMFQVWTDLSGGHVSLLGNDHPVADPSAFHDYRLEYTGGAYSLFVDGQLVDGPIARTVRPTAIWLGHPDVVWWASSPWTAFSVDSIRVASVPSASISSPAPGGTYAVGQAVSTSFSCSAAVGGPPISSCIDSNGSSSPGQLDTSAPGSHTYTVTATSSDGQTGTASITYSVAPPTAVISSPAPHQGYNQGESVATSFSCTEGTGGPGLSSCIDSNGSSSPGKLDTSTPGSHIYAVTARSSDGLTGTARITYTVIGPPTASIAEPGPGTYALGEVVPTSFSCAESSGGPGLSSCIDSNGSSSPGQLNTSTPGEYHSYTVTATSSDGQTGTAEIYYTVLPAPPIAYISRPPDNQTYNLGQVVYTTFSCTYGGYGSAKVLYCRDSNGVIGSTDGGSNTGSLATGTIGLHTYSAFATARDGQTGTASISYTVAGPPSASITSPADNQTYKFGQSVPTSFSCSEGFAGSGIASCTDSNGGSGTSGHLDTSVTGTHTYTVTATSSDGQTGTTSISYTVVPVTAVTLSPSRPSGSNGWYVGPVVVTVSATDNGWGIAQTRCVVDPSTVPVSFDQLAPACDSGVTVIGNGHHFVFAASRDVAGNKEVPISRLFYIDRRPPVTRIGIEPAAPQGANGWYTTPVKVTVSASDGIGSHVAETRCVLDPAIAPTRFGDIPTGCSYLSQTSIARPGRHTIYAASRDRAGNIEKPKALRWKLESTPPSVR